LTLPTPQTSISLVLARVLAASTAAIAGPWGHATIAGFSVRMTFVGGEGVGFRPTQSQRAKVKNTMNNPEIHFQAPFLDLK
jgi:hypothetical protein